MKHIFVLTLAASFFLAAHSSLAQDNSCEKNFGLSVAECAHSLAQLSPKLRAGAQKACVEEAKRAKEQCLTGVNSCVSLCEASYNSAATACTDFWVIENLCGPGDWLCEYLVPIERANCVSAAVDTLNSCTSNCNQ